MSGTISDLGNLKSMPLIQGRYVLRHIFTRQYI
nr:MAG TPA: hypothetical protein [Bacteriophage sp.]